MDWGTELAKVYSLSTNNCASGWRRSSSFSHLRTSFSVGHSSWTPATERWLADADWKLLCDIQAHAPKAAMPAISVEKACVLDLGQTETAAHAIVINKNPSP